MYDKSLLLPPERQKKNAGGIILKQVLKAISKPSTSKAKTISTELKEKYDPSELEEMAESFVTAVENNTKMTSRGTVSLKTPLSNIAKEAADILNKDRDATKNFIDSKDIIKISRLDDLRAGGGGKTGNILDSVVQSISSVTEKPSVMGSFIPEEAAGSRPVRKNQVIAGAVGAAGGSLLSGTASLVWDILNDEPPESKKEASAFEKAFSSAWKNNKKTFEFDGKTYTTELERDEKAMGGLLNAPERQAYSKGKIVVGLLERILGKKAKSTKLDMAERGKVADAVQEELDINPTFFDDLDDDEFDMLMQRMPQEEKAVVGAGEAPLDDMVEMMRGMNPKEAAEQLELFGSERNIYEYVDTLKPQELREFVGNVKKEDYEIFGNFDNFVDRLGPREMKAHGGTIGLLVPVEGMKPDEEMEDDYVSYVMSETLSDEEVDYVNKALEEDDKLSTLIDKLVLSSTEFTGEGEVNGPGTGTSDDIPARLSDGEFVFTKKAVDQLGAEKLEEMMKDAETEYDASREKKAVGGIMNDPTQDEKANLPDQAMEDEQIEEQMLDANRIPSLMRR